MANTAQSFRGLSLSATELRAMTDWPEALIEDYLALFDALITLANTVDIKNDILKAVTRVTTSPYEIKDTDEDVFFNTDAGPITANLRPGTTGRNYRLINAGSSGNKVIINPFGTELLFGLNATEYLADEETALITYEPTEGWI